MKNPNPYFVLHGILFFAAAAAILIFNNTSYLGNLLIISLGSCAGYMFYVIFTNVVTNRLLRVVLFAWILTITINLLGIYALIDTVDNTLAIDLLIIGGQMLAGVILANIFWVRKILSLQSQVYKLKIADKAKIAQFSERMVTKRLGS